MSAMTPARPWRLALAAAALTLAPHAFAQGARGSGDVAPEAAPVASKARIPRIAASPYIEAAQVISAQISPGDEVLTYTTVAAGVDAAVRGRNNEGSLSLRYERRFGWGRDQVDGDTITGLARGAVSLIPRTLQIEAGALAVRSRTERNGGTFLSPLSLGDATTKIYSAYAGPTLSTRLDSIAVNGGYRIGYTKVDGPDGLALGGSAAPDVFDSSTVHNAGLRAATRPGELFPVGVSAAVGYMQEDVSNFDQRVRDFHARADVTVPVSPTVALVGGVGYEDVEVSSRDVVRNAAGVPVIGPDGRYLTDGAGPRRIAYDTSGLIWDVGVIWRPSRRTSLEAHFGRRYGSDTFYGSFAYAPTRRSSVNLSVYDNLSGFGGQMNNSLAALPTQFEAIRNPLTGDLTGCIATGEQGACVPGVFGSVRSATFRARGVMASYGVDLGRINAGVSAGYDRRKFLAAPGTILASANGVVDETYWVASYLSGRIDRRSGYSASLYANWYNSGFVGEPDANAIGATLAYNRLLAERLSATAALGLEGISREALADIWTASALLGVRYTF